MRAPQQLFPRRERGVVLIFTLIILLILTIGAVALMKSMNISMFSSGNLALRQDLVNQADQAVATVMNEFISQTGPLYLSSTTNNTLPAYNYSATELQTNSQGVPTILFASDATFQASFTAPDIVAANYTVGSTSESPGVTMRYVVDRLCSTAGVALSASCVQSVAAGTSQSTGDSSGLAKPSATVYRLTVRVTGPRSTQAFLQTTFTKVN